MHYAHQRVILHRDLKPGNILLDEAGEPHVTDFGLAKIAESETEVTQTNAVMGSPAYMSPEQASGQTKNLTTAADVYSLGAVFYELLTGRPPFVGESALEIIQQVVGREPISPRALNPGVDRDVETICLKCLEKDPGQRYGSAEALAEDLERWLGNEPIAARSAGATTHIYKWIHRKPALASLAGSLIVVFALGFAGVLWQWHRADLNANRESKERRRAEAGELAARRNAYAADMNLASLSLAAGNWTEVRELLERYLPKNQSGAGGTPLESGRDLRGWEWRYLWGQSRSDELYTLGTHDGVVHHLAFSPDGKRLASADVRHAVRVWDLERGRLLASAVLHSNAIQALAFSPDGQFILTAGWDGMLVISHADTLKSAGPLPSSGSRLALMEGGKEHHSSAPGLQQLVKGFAFTRDGKGLLTIAKVHQTVQAIQWDWPNRHETRRVVLSNMNVRSSFAIALAPDDRTLAFVGGDEVVWLWDLERGSPIGRLTGHQFSHSWGRQIWRMAFSPDGRWLATGSSDQTARVWEVASLRQVAVLRHTALVHGASFSPDGRTLVTSSRDQTIKLWDWQHEKELATLKGHWRDALVVGFTPDGSRLVSGGRDNTIKVWSARPKAAAHTFFPLPPGVRETHLLSGHGHLVAYETNRPTATLWNLSNVRRERALEPLTNATAAALSPKADRRAIYSRDGSLAVRSLTAGREVIMADTQPMEDGRLFWSPDGTQLAAIDSHELRVWETASGRSRVRIQRNNPQFENCAFSPDNRFIVVPIGFGPIEVWDLAISRSHVLRGHQGSVTSVAFAPDYRRFATASTDGTVKLWSPDRAEPLVTFRSRASRYGSVAFSPDGTRLAAGSDDEGLVQLWDLESRREVGALKGHSAEVTAVAFLDDDTLVSIGLDGVRFWRAPTTAEIQSGQLRASK